MISNTKIMRLREAEPESVYGAEIDFNSKMVRLRLKKIGAERVEAYFNSSMVRLRF